MNTNLNLLETPENSAALFDSVTKREGFIYQRLRSKFDDYLNVLDVGGSRELLYYRSRLEGYLAAMLFGDFIDTDEFRNLHKYVCSMDDGVTNEH